MLASKLLKDLKMDSQCVQPLRPIPPGASSVLYHISLENVMFSQVGAHSPGPFVLPMPFPKHPLISLLRTVLPVHLL